MDRTEIKSKIVAYFRGQMALAADPSMRVQIQMGFLGELFKDVPQTPPQQRDDILSVAREVVHEFLNMGALYPGQRGQVYGNDFYPWLTITEYGKEIFAQEDWLPYDPEGYLKALKDKVPELDVVTMAYIGEAV